MTVEQYLEEHPRLSEDAHSLLDLIYNEFCLRAMRDPGGPGPEPEEFLRRFPGVSEQLRRVFEVHDFCSPSSDDDLTTGAENWPDLPGYVIERELGRGAMGVVYQANEDSPSRQVAIKVIRDSEFTASRNFARFENESNILARFRHPNIVQIHRVLKDGDRPYIVMELVRGGNLRDRLQGSPQPVRPTAELIESLARAVAHAHERKVVHRDLKPANILLEREDEAPPGDERDRTENVGSAELFGTAKLTDFGLAKRLDDQTDSSRSETIIGTPFYMAPEQANHQSERVGPASDVYGLGAILYEMLTGRPPFRGTDLLMTLEMVRSEDPVPPSRLQPRVPRDLETICLKCLEKDPAKRYMRATELADDLGRFLRGEPIQARRTPLWERAWKWSRRFPAAAALIVSVVVAVGSLLGVSLWYNGRLTAQRVLAVQRGIEVAKQRDQALANLSLARGSVDRFYTLVSLDPRLRDHDLEELRKELLRSAVAAYESFAVQRSDDPEIVSERGKVLGRLAEMTSSIGTRSEAIALFQQSVAVLEPLAARFSSEVRHQRDLAITLNNLGTEYSRGRDIGQAEQTYLRAREIREALLNRDPGNPILRGELASTLGNLAILHERAGRLVDAEAEFKETCDLFQQMADADPSDEEALRGVADTLGNLALFYGHTSRGELAEAAHLKSLKLRKELVSRHPSDSKSLRNLASSYSNLSGFYEDMGQPRQALGAFRDAIRIQEDLVASHPTISGYRNELSKTYNNLGIFHAANREAAPAESNLLKALELRKKLVEQYPNVAEFEFDLAGTHDNLGHLYSLIGRVDDAEKALLAGQQIRRGLVRSHPGIPEYQNSLAKGCDNFGGLYHETGRNAEAKAAYLESMSIRDELIRRYPQVLDYQIDWSKSKNNLGLFYDSIGRNDLALAAYKDAMEKRRELARQNPGMPDLRSLLARALDNMGTAHYSASHFEESESCYEQALEVRRGLAADFPGRPAYRGELAVNHNNLALARVRLKRMPEAEESFGEAIRLLDDLTRVQPKFVHFRRLLASSCNNLGSLCLNSGRKRKAATVLRKGVEVAELLVKDSPTVVDFKVSLGLLLGNLGNCLRDSLDQPLDALKSYDRAVSQLEEVVKQNPDHMEAVRELIKNRSERAHALCLLERYADSLPDWDRAISLAGAPKKASLEADRRDAAGMAEAHAKPDLAGRIAFEQAREFSTRARDVLKELASEAVTGGEDPSARYADRAIQRLRKALAAEYLTRPDVLDRLKKDTAFEPLRTTPGYREVIGATTP